MKISLTRQKIRSFVTLGKMLLGKMLPRQRVTRQNVTRQIVTRQNVAEPVGGGGPKMKKCGLKQIFA